MSTDTTDTTRTPAHELRRMSESEAKRLPHYEYERWERLTELHEQADEQRQEWQEDARVANDVLVYSDTRDLAAEVTVFGNSLLVYYSVENESLRKIADDLADIFGVDMDAVGDGDDAPELTSDDVADEDIEQCKAKLADLIGVAVVEWNGTSWDDIPPQKRDDIKDRIAAEWKLDGLMDAWTEIQLAVESNRDDRLERVEKFRSPERRGDR
jgi:hypothetical protein